MKTAFVIHPDDNVATLLADAEREEVRLVGARDGAVALREPIVYGHKLALDDLPEGAGVVKYGHVIALATRPVRRGEWVHLHNCRSTFDARSATLDAKSGATTDTRYA